MEPILASIPAAGTSIGVGRSSVYELIWDGKIETVKIGKRHLVVVELLRAYVAALRAGAICRRDRISCAKANVAISRRSRFTNQNRRALAGRRLKSCSGSELSSPLKLQRLRTTSPLRGSQTR